jgi:RNA polymerase sigma-70 factor, ECF subfamily
VVDCEVVDPAEAPAAAGACEDADLVRFIVGAAPSVAWEAEAELCRRLGPRIRLYGLRHLRSEAAAADLRQQVLLLTLESLRAGRLRDPEQLSSFVLGTCRLVVLDLRRGGERRQRLLERFGGDLSGGGARPESERETERLADCLRRLSERDRSVMVMTFYAERRTAEIAAELGLSAGNVRVIRHRALKQLRECMGRAGGHA